MRRPLFRRTSMLLALAVPLALAPALSISQPASAATNTVVSLTFDDGQSSQAATQAMLASHGMNGTYYINSAQVGSSSYYMTWPQIHSLADAGNEIGGHTLHHVNLTNVNTATATTEVCDDRQALLAQGFSPVTAFAYPEAAVNNTAKQVVQGCGYTSGRSVGNIYSNGACPGCPFAETVPPADAFNLSTPESAGSTTTLSQLQSYVTDAENNGGGWVVLTFHGICTDSCTGTNSLNTNTFTQFLDWLQPRSGNGTQVRTVGQVMTGGNPPPPAGPTTTISCDGTACSSAVYRTSPVSVALNATGGTGALTTRYTTDGSDPTTSPTAITYNGQPFNVASTTNVRYYSFDSTPTVEAAKSQTITIDTTPSTTISCNGIACSPAVYRTSPVSVTLNATGGSGGATLTTRYTTDGSDPTSSSTATTYSGAFNLTSSANVRYYTTDGTTAETPKSQQITIDTTPPNTIVSLTFDDGQSSQAATQTMLSSRGMTGTYYINSAMVGSSGYYMTWPQIHSLADAGNEIGGHTLHHTNLTSVNLATAQTEVCNDRQALLAQGFAPVASFAYPEAAVNNTAKQVVQGCGYTSARGVGSLYSAGACPDCTYAETVPPADALNLRTPDSAGSTTTLAQLQSYVTDAETHGGGWIVLTFHGICTNSCTGTNSLNTNTFTQFLDWLQPRSANGTQVRTVGDVMGLPPAPVPPTTTITCNGSACSSAVYRTSPVNVALSATGGTGGTGTLTTRYTTDGSNPATSNTAVTYSGPFQVAQTTTVRYYTTNGTAAETPKSQQITIDTTPTTAITCNNAACNSGFYATSPVTVRLNTTGGSGAVTTRYTTDGSDPTTSATRITYAGPFTVANTATVRYYSVDSLNAAETAKSQQIRIDTAAPAVTVTSPTGGSFRRNTAVTVQATATDTGSGGAAASGVASVVFRDGTAVIGTDTSAPYQVTWRSNTVGTHTLTAVATDVAGNPTTSAARTVTITR